ncbi:MAG TPA: peptidylprolyl isomerase [Haliea salexigens]|uniref:Peptidyl-prolyl cis-trans isomerase n=1 Tax=Haliea salexigens TaxID=287487 RepID=A0A3C1KS75_9GAMM|nr:peptidylprolyl isomerase [Haliea salexigens]MAA86040.1 peptidylprolyl isomerase [Haliea sp.]HAN29388.1 peptidylprolyl isomerase [Haliea salexigens]|tara:strand:- start:27794 stop:28222 length:429 start_codon:yes stop_codon:yes gene_type:complete
MSAAKAGDSVSIHYTGTLDDGTVFDSSDGRDPLQFEVGSGQIIPGLDRAIEGMTVGDKKQVNVAADDAYGQPADEARQEVARSQIPENIPLEPGLQLQMQTPDGQAIPVRVAEVGDDVVVLDANHPLAGKDLTFDIELVAIG